MLLVLVWGCDPNEAGGPVPAELELQAGEGAMPIGKADRPDVTTALVEEAAVVGPEALEMIITSAPQYEAVLGRAPTGIQFPEEWAVLRPARRRGRP